MNSEKSENRGWLARWRAPKRQERQIATLQEGFNELVGLTRSIREHMEQQALTQSTLVSMLEHMPGAVEGLKGVGEATKQQTETLQLLKKQLESAARNEGLMVDSMENFNKTLQLMDDMSKHTSQTVTTMADRTRDSEDMLRNLLERSERRLIAMIVTLIIVTLSVLGVGLYIGLGQRAEETAPPTPTPVEAPTAVDAEEEARAFERTKNMTDLTDGSEETEAIPDLEVTEEDLEADVATPETDLTDPGPEAEMPELVDPDLDALVIDRDLADEMEAGIAESLEAAEIEVDEVEIEEATIDAEDDAIGDEESADAVEDDEAERE